jgi:chromosome segregation ATPase
MTVKTKATPSKKVSLSTKVKHLTARNAELLQAGITFHKEGQKLVKEIKFLKAEKEVFTRDNKYLKNKYKKLREANCKLKDRYSEISKELTECTKQFVATFFVAVGLIVALVVVAAVWIFVY